MSIANEVIKAGPYEGNDVSTSFSLNNIKVFDQDDLEVFFTSTAGVEQATPLIRGTDYSVSLNADQNQNPGGTITYPLTGSPLATGSPFNEKLTIFNYPDFTQAQQIRAGTNPRVLENAYDKLTMLALRLKEVSARSLTFQKSTSFSDVVFPELPASPNLEALTVKADQTLQWSTISSTPAISVDETSTESTKNKMVSNLLAKGWEDHKSSAHGPSDTITQVDSETGTSTTQKVFTAERVKQAIRALIGQKGSSVASAASPDIWAGKDGDFIHITGTTGITDFADAPVAGAYRWLYFDGAVLLTNSAALDVQGGANYTTAAGDLVLVRADTVSTFILTVFKADGTPVVSVTPVFSEEFTSAEQTITTAGSLTIAHGLTGAPTLVQAHVVCKVADIGYSIGDIAPISFHGTNANATGIVTDSTNLNIRYSSLNPPITLTHKTTGALSSIGAVGNWRLVLRAWK